MFKKLKEEIYNISKKPIVPLTQKIQHYNLNLYYLNDKNIEKETNYLITHELNNFILNYGKYFKNYHFVLDYNDDKLSVINYYFLSSIAGISDLNFSIYPKPKKTKQYLPKKIKEIKAKDLKRLINKNEVIFISTFNPISQVSKSSIKYNKNIQVCPLKRFLPLHYNKMAEFYGLNELTSLSKTDIIFNSWCRLENQIFNEDYDMRYKPKEICLVYLSDDLKNNEKILQEVQDKDYLLYYYWEEDSKNEYNIKKQLQSFGQFVKNKSNIFGYANSVNEGYNPFEIAKKLNVNLLLNGKEIKEEI